MAHAADLRWRQRRLHAADEVAACDLAVSWAIAHDTSLARAVAAESDHRAYRRQHAWCLTAPRWWADDDRREDALLRERYEADDDPGYARPGGNSRQRAPGAMT